jgi:hypothetical protein
LPAHNKSQAAARSLQNQRKFKIGYMNRARFIAQTLCENAPQREMAGWLDEMIEVAGSVYHAMDFYLLAADDVENEVGFNHEDSISIFSKLWMPRYSPEQRVLLKQSNSFIQFVDKRQRSVRAIMSYEIIQRDQIVLRNREIAQCVFSRHWLFGEGWSSFVGE